jgi:hypothetical protein
MEVFKKNMKAMAICIAGTFSLFGCVTDEVSPKPLGNVKLTVTGYPVSEIPSVHWAVTDSDGLRVAEDDIAVADTSSSIINYIFGLPVGTDYTMSLTATMMKDEQEIGDCSKTAAFDVFLDQEVPLDMSLTCSSHDTPDGGDSDDESNDGDGGS